MKRTTFIAAMLCLLGPGLSCTHDEPNNSDTGTSQKVEEWQDSTLSGDAVIGMKMLFNVGGGMSVERTAQTRATTDINGTATFSTNDLVAVAVTRSGGSEVVKLYKVKSDGSLEYAGGDNDPFVWTSSSETVSLRAWSYGTSTNLAYTLTAPETRDYTLETDQNTNGYLELLYCKAADKSYSGGTISLNFYHQLARVVFNVTHERSGTLSVTSSSVGNSTSFPVAARFSVPTGSSNVGTWATRSTYGTITPKTETTQSGYQKTYSAIIFPQTYAQDTKLFTITNDDGNYVYNVSEAAGASLSAGNQYNYTITIKDTKDIRKNPLWYIAEYRLAQSGTAFDTTPGWDVTYMWSFIDAMKIGYTYQTTAYNGYAVPVTDKKINGIAYHIPTALEFLSIVPFDYSNNDYETMFGTEKVAAGTIRNETCTFGYSNTTKYSNGSNNTSNTGITYKAYWGNYYGSYTIANWTTSNDDGLRYAIRFLGTDFCSVWRYKTTGTLGGKTSAARRLEITSRLIDPISPSDLTTLSSKMSEIESASESYWTDETWGAVKRTIYWGGISNGTGKNYSANTNGHYVTTSASYFNLVYAGLVPTVDQYGYDLMLFRNE